MVHTQRFLFPTHPDSCQFAAWTIYTERGGLTCQQEQERTQPLQSKEENKIKWSQGKSNSWTWEKKHI